MRFIGSGLDVFKAPHSVAIDSHDDVWYMDAGNNLVIELDPQPRLVLGKKPEAWTWETHVVQHGRPGQTFISRRRVYYMKRVHMLSHCFFVLGVALAASMLLPQLAQAQFGGTPEVLAHQLALEKTYPKMQITDQFLHLSIPGYTMGQTVGVATNSKGDLFVYSRTNPQGIARGGKAAMLWEFDQNHKFVKEWGPHNCAESFAHAVRVDRHDNVWIVSRRTARTIFTSPTAETAASRSMTAS